MNGEIIFMIMFGLFLTISGLMGIRNNRLDFITRMNRQQPSTITIVFVCSLVSSSGICYLLAILMYFIEFNILISPLYVIATLLLIAYAFATYIISH